MSTRKKNQKKSPTPVSLTIEQIRRLPKPHAGFEAFAEQLLALYQANKDKLQIAGLDDEAILATIRAFPALHAAELAAHQSVAVAQGTRLYSQSTVWSAMLDIYARALRGGRTDAAMKRAIAAFAEFMKNGPRKKGTTTTTP